jgi:hypothetical protein
VISLLLKAGADIEARNNVSLDPWLIDVLDSISSDSSCVFRMERRHSPQLLHGTSLVQSLFCWMQELIPTREIM